MFIEEQKGLEDHRINHVRSKIVVNKLKLLALKEKHNVVNKPYKQDKETYQKATGTIIRAGYIPRTGKPIVR